MADPIQNWSGEIWKPIVGYEDSYKVSSMGRVLSLTRWVKHPSGGLKIVRARIKKQVTIWSGYKRVELRARGLRRMFSVHRLVLEAFVGECPKGYEAAHNNGVRDDNRLENLRWATVKENHADKRLHGTSQHGSRNGNSKLTEKDVVKIHKLRGTVTNKMLAERFGISLTNLKDIFRGNIWQHVEKPCTTNAK